MSNTSTTSSNGSRIGLPTLLGLLFVTLKLCGVIHWSWVWVLAPFWLGLAFTVVTVVTVVAVAFASRRR